MDEIEPRIKPLVDALNNTELVSTFSSCEGHFGFYDPQDFTDKEKADLRFDPEEGVSEREIELFFSYVLEKYEESGQMHKSALSIYKKYTSLSKGEMPIDFVYVLEIRPFNPYITNEEKRNIVDDAIDRVR